MDFEGIILSELRQTDKGKYFMISQVEIKRISTPYHPKLREHEIILWLLEMGGWEREKWMKVVKRYKLPVISTGDVRYNMMTIVNTANMLHMQVVKSSQHRKKYFYSFPFSVYEVINVN